MPDFIITTPTSDQELSLARTSESAQALRAAEEGPDRKKIDTAARSFESLLVGHWLEQAEKSFASVPGTNPEEQDDSSRDQLLSIACQSLAQGLSRTGAFGIAAMISKQLASAADAGQRHQPSQPANGVPSGGVEQPQQHQAVSGTKDSRAESLKLFGPSAD